MDAGDDVLLALAEHLNQVLLTQVFDPQAHAAERLGRAIHQEPLGKAPDALRRLSQDIERDTLDDGGQALVGAVDVKRRVRRGRQSDVGVVAVHAVGVRRRARVALPRVAGPAELAAAPRHLAAAVWLDLRLR